MRTTIKEIADVQIGYQSRGKIKTDETGNWRIIQIKDIDEDNKLDTEHVYRITPKSPPEKYQVTNRDVLFISKGSRNVATAIDRDINYFIAAGYFFILRPKFNNILPEYLAWYINQKPAQDFIKQNKRGTRMPVMPKGVFQKLKVDIPTMETQEAIIRLNELRREEARLVAEIQEKRSAMVNAMCLRAARQAE